MASTHGSAVARARGVAKCGGVIILGDKVAEQKGVRWAAGVGEGIVVIACVVGAMHVADH